MTLRIRQTERKIYEQSLKFLDPSLKEIEFELPSLYTSKALAVFKGNDEIDPDVSIDIEDLSWDVDSSTVSGKYLMVAYKDVPGIDSVKAVMDAEYKKAVLPEALTLVDYIDVEAIRNALNKIVLDSEGTDWELGYSLGDIQDLADAPGIIDCSYVEVDGEDAYSVISVGVGAFGFLVGYTGIAEPVETTDPKEAEKVAKEFCSKYK